ncbi:cation diffusion facilitator family transporter [Aminivibrio sp.]|jgi:cation diffusion facilitator family transporter|uniref:cation diffusion facilitator family transporter n=1 Tax=Aminivibrio sp. TaxID=1872489 RepID=UPI001A4FBCCC|nr:cation diffusion facilitator family transporter [Aminivibrio sp.]MBL3539543.1 cation transporter [Aminivibrio sp.]
MERNDEARRITFLGLVINLFLTAGKYFAGYFGRSSAMIADATHSLSDLLTDLIVYFGLSAAGKPADSHHPYGHGKIEAVLSAVCGISLLLAAGGIFFSGAARIWSFLVRGAEMPGPGMIALAAAAVSVLLKEWLFRYTIEGGRRLQSSALIAKAWDHRSDALSSVGTLVGIAGAFFGGERWRVLDPLAALVVSVFIVTAALPILRDSLDELIEAALPGELEKELQSAIVSVPEVRSFHKLKTRRIGSSIAVDVHIQMNGALSLSEAHEISRRVEHEIWEIFGHDAHISLHMEPASQAAGR